MAEQILSGLLEARGLKLVDLARLLKVDKSTVTRWSQTEVPPERLDDIARVTGIRPHDLRPDLASIFAPTPEPERAS